MSILVWVKCNYVPRDGEFNPDRLLVNDTGHFAALSDAVLYNALQWALEGEPSTKYSKNVGKQNPLSHANYE